MRLQCKAALVSSKVGSSNEKPITASLAIGENNKEIFLTISTTKNKIGEKFKVTKENLIKVHTKFVSEGKVTLCFLQPPKNILISNANPSQLQIFLKILSSAVSGNGTGNLPKLPKITETKERHLKSSIKTMKITEKKNYPFTEGFPLSLTELTVSGCSLGRIDPRWFKLVNLVSLDLSGNNLGDKMNEFRIGGFTQLKILNLSDNGMSWLPEDFWKSLNKKIQVLNLSKNALANLPDGMAQFTWLRELNVGENNLEVLPEDIGQIPSLRVLRAHRNKIKFYPGSLIQCRLDSLDLTGNDEESTKSPADDALRVFQPLEMVPTLWNLAGKVVLDNRINVAILPIRVRNGLFGIKKLCDCCGKKHCLPDNQPVFRMVFAEKFAKEVTSIGGDRRNYDGKYVLLRFNVCSWHCAKNMGWSWVGREPLSSTSSENVALPTPRVVVVPDVFVDSVQRFYNN